VLAALDKERALRVLTCSTEDEANAVAAGLWMGGEPFVLMIQHGRPLRLVNTLRGVAMDGRVPIFYMIGSSAARRTRTARVAPLDGALLRAAARRLRRPARALEGTDDVHLIPEYYRLAQKRRGPRAVLVGLETA